ncbi:hypothetical protein MUK42_12308 [Musa troglodytarum]|uniref:Uncharacterized protein n=1 Tax=Musa troglodytarum TaxID=320322 RepID=A0A9E7GSU2_9LILI|nr:hypothetical protein MUK42_12308 [Musa troglodytarum]
MFQGVDSVKPSISGPEGQNRRPQPGDQEPWESITGIAWVFWGTEEEWMASWRRSLGNLRTFVGNATGGLRGGANLASWVVAGTLAYFLWVKPAQDLKREQEDLCITNDPAQERAAAAAASDPYRYVEKRKPIPDPQDLHGKKMNS